MALRVEATANQVCFSNRGAKALPARILSDHGVPAWAYLRRRSLVEELYSWGRVISLPYRRQPITPANETVGTELSCVSKGPLLRWGIR